jgi:hypothetical protein
MDPLSGLISKLKSFFLYNPQPSGATVAPTDEVYDKDLLLNVDHQVINVGDKLQELDQSSRDLGLQTTEIQHQFESIKHFPETISEINTYNKTQDAQIETIKAAEFDVANELKNVIEKQETMKADLIQLRADINDLKIPLRQASGSATLAAGHPELQVSNSMVDSTSRVFTTLTTPANVQLSVIAKTPNHSFTVRASSAPTEDLTFDYWIVNEPQVYH